MKQIQDKLIQLAQRQAEIARRMQALKQRQASQERKDRTRRLILLGNQLDQYMEGDPSLLSRVHADLDDKLHKDLDRSLFGLAPREVETEASG